MIEKTWTKQIYDKTDYQGHDDLAVRIGLEFYTGANASTQSNVVIYFTIDSEYNFAIDANQGLCTRICNDDMNIYITRIL